MTFNLNTGFTVGQCGCLLQNGVGAVKRLLWKQLYVLLVNRLITSPNRRYFKYIVWADLPEVFCYIIISISPCRTRYLAAESLLKMSKVRLGIHRNLQQRATGRAILNKESFDIQQSLSNEPNTASRAQQHTMGRPIAWVVVCLRLVPASDK